MPQGTLNVGQELLNVPIGDMIRSMAVAIADAQWSLDEASMIVAEMMSGRRLLRDPDTGTLVNQQGRPLTANQPPQFVDSTVYFGHIYDNEGRATPNKVSLIELGFVPNFYQFVETIIEVRIAVKMGGSTDESSRTVQSNTQTTNENRTQGFAAWWHNRELTTGNSAVALASSVDASYANKYSYSVDGSSYLRTKLVPVPPPAILQERIRALIETERAEVVRRAPQTSPTPTPSPTRPG